MNTRLHAKRAALVAHRARQQRFALTDSEQKLFRALNAGKLGGLLVRRQVPLGRHIVDLLVPSARLVIEVDGKYHARRRGTDARRDEALRWLGYRVLRLEAELVMRDLPEAVRRLREALGEAT